MPCPLPCPSPYTPRAATDTVLYDIVRAELEPFLAAARAAEVALPPYVEAELRAFLRCGVLACGFGRARCEACGFDRLVPFSCKRRGVCSSCGGRRMSETAAEQVTRLWPAVPVRQWVLSLPWALRLPVARDPGLLTKVSRIFFEAVRDRLRQRVVGVEAADEGVRREIGAVTFVQRFGSALNLNPHLHVLVVDGVFLCREDGATPRFVPTPPPTRRELAAVLQTVAARVARIQKVGADDDLGPLRSVAAARGTFTRMRDADEADGPAPREPEGFRGGAGVEHAGFNLHAGVRVAADDRTGLERLCRYVARPAVCAERVALREDGTVTYRLKTPRRSGETHRVMRPEEFLARLVALIPPPRFPLVRYHGVFAPNSPWRGAIVPGPRRVHHRDRGRARASVARCEAAASDGGVNAGLCLTRWDWATLLRHVWGVDALACPRCEGRMRFIAVIRDRAVIERILLHLGLPHEPPRAARARDPC
jgi:hypothetical protein